MRLIVPVPVTVRLVVVTVVHAVPPPAIVHVPEPTAIVRVFELLDDTADDEPLSVTLYPLALKVPAVMNRLDDVRLIVYASCSVTDPPGVLTVNGCVKVIPALVTVWLPRPARVTIPDPDRVVPVPLIQLP